MKKNGIRAAALLLAACMVLSLAACGKKGGGDTQQLSGMVYVPEFVDCGLEDIRYVNQVCSDGKYIYFSADVLGEEVEDSWTDPDTGETETYTYFESRTGLFRVDLDSGAAAEMENYALPQPDGEESETYITGIQAGEEGTLWVTEQMTKYVYDLPADFDEETDEKWEYQTGYEETLVRRHLDSTGQELERVDISGAALQEKLGVEYLGGTAFDKAGNIYVSQENKVIVLDKDLNKLFALDMPMEDMWGSLLQMADGTMAMQASYEDRENETYGNKLMFIDTDNKSWGAEYALSSWVYVFVPGGGDYVCYYQNNDSIYGLKAGAQEGEKLFSWMSAGLDRSNINGFTVLADGRVAAVTQEWTGEQDSPTVKLALLTPTDASTLPEKTTLTVAAMWMGYSMRNKIIAFNQNSDTCRIEVVDYSEYNTGADESAGLTKLNTEIVAGHVPDLLITDELPVDRYAARGILEDLWPYIEADTEIGGREGLMEHVLDVASIDGKLCQVFSTFGIRTVAGPAALTGDRMSWTLSELQAALAQMPEGCTIFGQDDTRDWILSQVLSINMSNFVDWETGKCSFDSDGFKALLEFCSSFPEEFEWTEDMEYHSDMERIRSGEQMLSRIYMSGFTSPQLYDLAFNGGSAFIGYPKEDGSVGSCFALDTGVAMSSSCRDKDAAWSFIRQLLLPQASEDNYDEDTQQYYFGGYPVNRSDFEKMQEGAMKVVYQTDENGDPLLDEEGQPLRMPKDAWYMGEGQPDLSVYAATQEDVDRTMALYNAIDSLYGYDESIYQIIEEQIGAYFAGDKSLDATASEIQNRVQLYMGENM